MSSNAKTVSFTQGAILPRLAAFAVPTFLALVLQTLYGTVDVLVIGNFGSTAGVSAVATGSQVLTLATFLIAGFTTASTVLIGQYLGRMIPKMSRGSLAVPFRFSW